MENIQIILGLILVVIIGVLIYKSHQKSKRIELFETIFMIAQQTLLFNSSYFLNLNSLDKLKLPHENPKFDILLSEYNKLNKDNLDITIRTALEEWLSEIFYKSNGSIFQKETADQRAERIGFPA